MKVSPCAITKFEGNRRFLDLNFRRRFNVEKYQNKDVSELGLGNDHLREEITLPQSFCVSL